MGNIMDDFREKEAKRQAKEGEKLRLKAERMAEEQKRSEPPQQEKPKSQLTEKQMRGCGALAFLVVIIVILFFIFKKTTTPNVTYSVAQTTTSTTANAINQTLTPPATYSINQIVTIGKLAQWTITSVQNLGNDISIPDLPKTTPGKFIEVSFMVENLGSKTVTNPSTPTIIDSQKREFQPANNYWYYVPQNAAFLFPTLQPDIPVQFSIIYELPLDSTGLQFKINDLTNSLILGQTALVTLGF
jgi:hypothetical protein